MQKNNFFSSHLYRLLLLEGAFSKIKSQKEVKKTVGIKVFLTFFA
jgi:hypothetical protein